MLQVPVCQDSVLQRHLLFGNMESGGLPLFSPLTNLMKLVTLLQISTSIVKKVSSLLFLEF
jgi:hypothetical protein